MNIFCLDHDPYISAEMHCDKHILKMVIEYAQLLSTAHRVLDGEYRIFTWTNEVFDAALGRLGPVKRTKPFWVLPGETASVNIDLFERTVNDELFHEHIGAVEVQGRKCYNASHMNHPCAVWARASDANYHWLRQLFEGCLREYTKRYGKIHATEKLREFFLTPPKHIAHGQQTPFALAMPDEYKVDDEILSYQNYYVGGKARFAKWTNTTVPKWFLHRADKDESHFARTNPIL